MIKVSNVDYSYDSKTKVLSKVSLSVAPNETVAIMGASGSGKTTLMDIISGLKKPTNGAVDVFEKNLYDMGERELEQFKLSSIGYIFQHYNLVPFLSAYENVLLPAMILKRRNEKIERQAVNLLNKLNMGSKKNVIPEKLSGGERQRVAIARAMIMSPKVILADEPTGALDSENTKVFMEYFISIIKQLGSAALIVTHDERVAAYCDRTVRLG